MAHEHSFPHRKMNMLQRFYHNCVGAGTILVEFIAVVPVMLAFLLGTAELQRYLSTSNRLTVVRSSISNLFAEKELFNQTEVNSIFTTANQIVSPLDPLQFHAGVLSVRGIPNTSAGNYDFTLISQALSPNFPAASQITARQAVRDRIVSINTGRTVGTVNLYYIALYTEYTYTPFSKNLFVSDVQLDDFFLVSSPERTCFVDPACALTTTAW